MARLPKKTQNLNKEIHDELGKAETLDEVNFDIKRMEGKRAAESYYLIRVGS